MSDLWVLPPPAEDLTPRDRIFEPAYDAAARYTPGWGDMHGGVDPAYQYLPKAPCGVCGDSLLPGCLHDSLCTFCDAEMRVGMLEQSIASDSEQLRKLRAYVEEERDRREILRARGSTAEVHEHLRAVIGSRKAHRVEIALEVGRYLGKLAHETAVSDRMALMGTLGLLVPGEDGLWEVR